VLASVQVGIGVRVKARVSVRSPRVRVTVKVWVRVTLALGLRFGKSNAPAISLYLLILFRSIKCRSRYGRSRKCHVADVPAFHYKPSYFRHGLQLNFKNQTVFSHCYAISTCYINNGCVPYNIHVYIVMGRI